MPLIHAVQVATLPAHSLLVDDAGNIHSILPVLDMDAFVAEYKAGGGAVAREVECDGRAALPGFVDSHTHAVFAGDRCHEMKMKLAGATYVEVHKAGGGINFTVGSVNRMIGVTVKTKRAMTTACLKRTCATASTECRQREPISEISPE